MFLNNEQLRSTYVFQKTRSDGKKALSKSCSVRNGRPSGTVKLPSWDTLPSRERSRRSVANDRFPRSYGHRSQQSVTARSGKTSSPISANSTYRVGDRDAYVTAKRPRMWGQNSGTVTDFYCGFSTDIRKNPPKNGGSRSEDRTRAVRIGHIACRVRHRALTVRPSAKEEGSPQTCRSSAHSVITVSTRVRTGRADKTRSCRPPSICLSATSPPRRGA